MPAEIQYKAADLILAALGATPTTTSVNLLVAWMPQEYTPAELAVANNPMATSQNAPGQVGYCLLPNGERSSEPCYDTLAHGATANALTLQNGYYPHLLAGLMNSDAGTFFSPAGMSELSTWCGGCNYGPRIQNTYNSLPTPPFWALSGTIPTLPANAAGAPKWLLWLGLAGAGVGAVILGWQWSKREPVTGFARRRDETHMDARVDPKWMTYISVTEKDAAEIAKPLSACDVFANLKAASERAGVPVLEDRNLPEATEAMYIPPDPRLPQFPKGRIMLGVQTTRSAEKCRPYGVQVTAHEVGHSKLHNPDCLPMFRGVSYASENHKVEEQEVELSSFAAMVMLGLPVETYEGVVYPAGTEEIDWGLAQRNLDPETYTNVKWATDLLVRAGQGDTNALVDATCPLARKSA